jgi:undecaprenyl-diphosphatase
MSDKPTEPPAASHLSPVARPFFDPIVRRRAIRLLGILTILFVLLVGSFAAFDMKLPYDEALTVAAQGLDNGSWDTLFEVVGFAGYSPWNVRVGASLCIGIGLWLGWKVGVLLAGMTVVQGLLGILIKFPITVERPMETDLRAPLDIIKASSFPSGHTTMYIVLFGFPVYLLWRHGAPRWLAWPATIIYIILVLLVGPARVSVGAHWWSDVVGAFLLGFFVLLLGIEVYERRLVVSPEPAEGDRQERNAGGQRTFAAGDDR